MSWGKLEAATIELHKRCKITMKKSKEEKGLEETN